MSNPEPASISSSASLPVEVQRATLSKVVWRLLPLLFFCYVIAYIDRINVSFAKLQLREVFGMDEKGFSSAYGLGAGLFFVGYFIFEVPSNLILQRVGARIWIARIMIVWGIVSITFMFLKSATMFYVMRFLLGAAEAGFFPGVILYLTYWFPAHERARTVAMFVVGGVLAGVIGSPVSGALLRLNGLGGLSGWQWLFLIEGIPAVLMGIVILLALPNRPQEARWLSRAEKQWIQDRLAPDPAVDGPAPQHRLIKIFTNGRVWLLCLLYFLMNVGGYGTEFWLPTFIAGFAISSTFVIGIITAIPYFAAGVAMILSARYSDKTGERRGVVALSAFTAAIGFAFSAWFKNPYLAMAALTLAFVGVKSTIAPFWAMATTFLGSTAAAAGIAFINSVGNLGGYAGSHLVGLIKAKTDGNVVALLVLGAALLGMAIFTLAIPKTSHRPAA